MFVVDIILQAFENLKNESQGHALSRRQVTEFVNNYFEADPSADVVPASISGDSPPTA